MRAFSKMFKTWICGVADFGVNRFGRSTEGTIRATMASAGTRGLLRDRPAFGLAELRPGIKPVPCDCRPCASPERRIAPLWKRFEAINDSPSLRRRMSSA